MRRSGIDRRAPAPRAWCGAEAPGTFAVLLLALSAGCSDAIRGMGARATQLDRPSWWYPYFIRTDTLQDFRVRVNDVVTTANRSIEVSEEAQFTVWIAPRPGNEPGCIVSIVPPDAEAQPLPDNLTQTCITNWASTNHDGITVTPSALLVRDASLFQGPWRAGDRFTVAGFAYVFFVVEIKAIGFAHFTVAEVRGTEVRLTFDFWVGESGPAIRGVGTLAFAHDDGGITRVEAHWKRCGGDETREVDLVVNRTGICRL